MRLRGQKRWRSTQGHFSGRTSLWMESCKGTSSCCEQKLTFSFFFILIIHKEIDENGILSVWKSASPQVCHNHEWNKPVGREDSEEIITWYNIWWRGKELLLKFKLTSEGGCFKAWLPIFVRKVSTYPKLLTSNLVYLIDTSRVYIGYFLKQCSIISPCEDLSLKAYGRWSNRDASRIA